MKICDTHKLHMMVDEFCIDNRPKSIDIHNMINKCIVDTCILQPREYKPNYDNDLEIENCIKLEMAMEILKTLAEEVSDTISFKQFIEHFMYLYDLTQEDLLNS